MEKYEKGSSSVQVELLLDIDHPEFPASECCIYKVPTRIRKRNERAYTPQLVSIGPFHRGKLELADMEKHKKRYRKRFEGRIEESKREQLKNFIKIHEQKIRDHYAEAFRSEGNEFVEMILTDAIFIIELFVRYYFREKNDFLLINVRLGTIKADLFLLENQLPFFVLDQLYNLAFSEIGPDLPPFLTLSCLFFELHRRPYITPYQKANVKHFTDLYRHAVVESHPTNRSKEFKEDLPNAVKLHKSGVKFKRRWGTSLVDIRIVKRRGIISFFYGIELQVPRIEIYDYTESLVRNIMALELCHYPFETFFCSYIELLDFLIDTESDVDFLIDEGIIYNNLGDNAAIARKFNNLRVRIPANYGTYYWEIFKDLHRHYDNPWNHAKATLKSVYFSNRWRGFGTVAAIILLLLTFMQTLCSFVSCSSSKSGC